MRCFEAGELSNLCIASEFFGAINGRANRPAKANVISVFNDYVFHSFSELRSNRPGQPSVKRIDRRN